jgi:hypothetical protein
LRPLHWLGLVVMLDCAAAQPVARTAPAPSAAYPGRCELLGLDMVESPNDRATGGDTGSVQLVATYRPGAGAEAAPFGLSFRVRRERVNDLRAHLEQHPTVLCNPKPEAGRSAPAYNAQVPPFEGQSGQPVSH